MYENMEKIYYEIALIINEELYKESKISSIEYKKAEEKIRNEINKQ